MILLCWITNIQVLKSCFPGFTGFMNFSDAFYEVAAISAHFTQTSLSWEEQVLPITTLYAFIYRDGYLFSPHFQSHLIDWSTSRGSF